MSGDSQEARRSAYAAAQTLERRGLLDSALQAYHSAGAIDDVARLLVGARKFTDAGRVLLDSFGVPPERVGLLPPAQKKQALQAAICFSRGGEVQLAATLFLALNERERAAEVLRRAGDLAGSARLLDEGRPRTGTTAPAVPVQSAPITLEAAQALEAQGKLEPALDAYLALRQPAHAGRAAYGLKRYEQGGELYLVAGMPYEAAACFHLALLPSRCLEALVKVPRDDARYRAAAVQAIRVATDLNQLDFTLDHFLARFLTERPQHEREVEAFYLAGKLFQRHAHPDVARDAYRKLSQVRPDYRDVAQQLALLDSEARGSAREFEQILKEESVFRGERYDRASPLSATLPELPDLPGLPPLPASPVRRPPVTPTPIIPAPVVPAPAFPPPPPAAQPLVLEPGSVVAGRYRLEQKIGQGGMASVFRALDLELGERIALKVFTKLVPDEQMVQRFKQELTLSRQLNHPNIIRLYDIGAVQGFKYITMELLSGGDLKSELGRPLPLARGLDLLVQACQALQHAHDKGIVHRDVKPANLFLTQDGVVKLMDFGIAKRTATPGLTVAGMIAGTPEYMSPEQINGFDKVGPSTDLYALGVMAFELFTGAVPFQHPEIMPLLVLQLTEPPPSPRARNPQLPVELERIVLRLLEKDPARRYASCRELQAALEQVRRTLPA